MEAKTTTRKFKVSEFYKLAEVGILSENDRVELLDAQIMHPYTQEVSSLIAGEQTRMNYRVEATRNQPGF